MKESLPVEYKKGYAKFLGCRIDLSKRPLIPRQETEFWVKKAIKETKSAKRKAQSIKVLDIFAGSGCIGIAVLKNIKNSSVDFMDIDKKAVEQIRINLKLNKIFSKRYKIYRSDLFEKLKGEKYDYVFANPPYVAKARIKEVQPSVLKYEPEKALFGGKKGLDIIKKFLRQAKDYLKGPAFAKASAGKGIIFMEFDPLQKKDIELLLTKQKYGKFEFNRDQFNQWRWVKIFY